jgi:glycosyltransferase involved in cell wall biosynthesis
MPSLYEACPLPIIEAMAAGCPIVTADRFGTAELAGNAAMLVDPESVGSISAGLAQVLDDRALSQRLKAASRERAMPLTWARCARRTMDVLESLAA